MSSELGPVALPGGRFVPENALHERVTTSGGPGGQHANRTASSVELRVEIAVLPLTDDEHSRIRSRLASRIRSDGTVAVTSADSRSQFANRRAVRRQLEELLAEALAPDISRVATSTSKAAIRRTRDNKRRKSFVKRLRRRLGEGDVD